MTIEYECPDCAYELESTLTLPETSRQRKCPDCDGFILEKPLNQKPFYPLRRKKKNK